MVATNELLKPTAKKIVKKPIARITGSMPAVDKKPVLTEDETYTMSFAVKAWIERAHAQLTYYMGKCERLQEENDKLRRANKIMEQRVMGASVE
jgi:hypothetical protein